MNPGLESANFIIGMIGIVYCSIIVTVLLFRKSEMPVYTSYPQKKANVFQKAVGGIMNRRIKPIRHTDDQLWEIDKNDRGKSN